MAWSSEDHRAEEGAYLWLRSWWLWGVLEPSPWEITKGISSRLRVACRSPSCVGCAAPSCEFGVWCQLAREPLSGWIATTRTRLPASKWTSVKIIVSSFDSEVIGLHWYSFLWLFDSIGDWLIPLHGGITLHPFRAFTFGSVASFEDNQESCLVVSETL
jgi:hypothetical protein